VGVPIGTPEIVNVFVQLHEHVDNFWYTKAHDIKEQDVQKLRIVHDPKIHYDLYIWSLAPIFCFCKNK
jgi:hypothetical protein